jgi:pilus assembly protein CpaB
MGKWRPFVFLGLALIVGLIVSVVTYNWLQQKSEVKKIVSSETLPIAVAIIDLPWGKVLDKESIKMEPYLTSSLPQGYFSDPNSLVGRVIIFPVKAKEPILESRLASIDTKTGGVSAVISPNNRAMAVKVDKVIGVSGFIFPGNRVDVLVTITPAGGSLPMTKTVLENINVLAAGTELQEKEKGKPVPVDVITLEVTPEEAEKLAFAASEGRLLLALRNPVDTKEVLTKGITVSALLASYTPAMQTKVVSEKEGKIVVKEKKAFTVDLIKGNSMSTLKF